MKLSPAAMPSEPPMKWKSCTITTAGTVRISPTPIATASRSPVVLRAEVRASL